MKVYGARVEMPYEGPIEVARFLTEEGRDQWVEYAEEEYANDLRQGYYYLESFEDEIYEDFESWENWKQEWVAHWERVALENQKRAEAEYAENYGTTSLGELLKAQLADGVDNDE